MQKVLAYALLFALALFCSGTASFAKKEKAAEPSDAEDKDAASEEDTATKKKKDAKSFEDVIEGFEKVEGLFTFHRDDDEGKLYLEIQPEQLGQMYLCSITRQAGDGYYFDSGAMLWEYPFEFQRVGKKIELLDKNVYFRAGKDTAIHRAVARDLSDSLVGAAKIVSDPHPETGAVLVDPAAFFVQDVAAVGYIFREFVKAPYSFDKENSHFGEIKSFEANTEIDVVLRFKSQTPKPFPTVPDSRSFRHIYHYSLSKLPDTDYQPRLADDRVGHFITMYQDYSSLLQDTPYVRYVNRWQLEKAESKFETSKPRQPIVFWLENTIPVAYRDAVREGILLWNDAFEQIGFEDAIVVKQQPDDAEWDASDVRHNVVRWIVQPGGGYAVGPSRTNPFTGQIYDADIRVSADMIRYVYLSFQRLANPLAATPDAMLLGDDPMALAGMAGLTGPADDGFRPDAGAPGLCDFAAGAVQQAAFGWSLVAARVDAAGVQADAEQYLNDFIVTVMAHEVGHTLGLRHNFKASTIHANSNLQSDDVADLGLTGSVMDYTPVNIAPDGQAQGAYWQTNLGPYDYWAIEYAYKPHDPESGQSKAAMLEEIASRVADPMLQYATDEDAWSSARGMDPTANRWDLGRDPIRYHADRVALAEELWSKMEAEFVKPGQRYQQLRQVFGGGMGQYAMGALNVTKYVAGVHNHRDHIGDPDGRLPFVPVSTDRQREALAFLTEHVFGPDAFEFPASIMEKLASERLPDFSGSVWQIQRLDYPIHAVVSSIQAWPMARLYSSLSMSRMLDVELWAAEGKDVLTLPEMFDSIRDAVWEELADGSNINSFRRNLQRAHLQRLTRMLIQPRQSMPEDAATLARADLKKIRAAIDGAMSGGGLDAYTEAHLDETAARVDAALDAGLQRQLGL